MTVFGVHIGLQDTTPDAVLELAVAAEHLGYGWVSTWDHFVSSSADSADGGCLEGVSMQAAIATATHRVRVGSLVYNTTYRHPAVLANVAATIDHLSHGRADLGIGAGWSEREHVSYGFPYRAPRERLDAFAEAAHCVHALLREEVVDFDGRYVRLVGARCDPRPVQPALPLWIGGRGERRTLRIAAQYADGWNGAFLSPEEFAAKRAVLHRHCEDLGRDPAGVRCSVNVGVGLTDALLEHHFRTMGDPERRTGAAAVTGSGQQLVDQIADYLAVGADQVNFTWRAPFDLEALHLVAEATTSFAPPTTTL